MYILYKTLDYNILTTNSIESSGINDTSKIQKYLPELVKYKRKHAFKTYFDQKHNISDLYKHINHNILCFKSKFFF